MLAPYLGGGGGSVQAARGQTHRGPVKLLGSTRRPLHVLKQVHLEKNPERLPSSSWALFGFFFFHIWIFSTSVRTNRPVGLSSQLWCSGFHPAGSTSLILLKRLCQQPATRSGTDSPTRHLGAPFTSEPARLLPHMTAGTS